MVKELNISITTAQETLQQKGNIVVDSNPNQRISAEAAEILYKAHRKDKEAHEKTANALPLTPLIAEEQEKKTTKPEAPAAKATAPSAPKTAKPESSPAKEAPAAAPAEIPATPAPEKAPEERKEAEKPAKTAPPVYEAPVKKEEAKADKGTAGEPKDKAEAPAPPVKTPPAAEADITAKAETKAPPAEEKPAPAPPAPQAEKEAGGETPKAEAAPTPKASTVEKTDKAPAVTTPKAEAPEAADTHKGGLKILGNVDVSTLSRDGRRKPAGKGKEKAETARPKEKAEAPVAKTEEQAPKAAATPPAPVEEKRPATVEKAPAAPSAATAAEAPAEATPEVPMAPTSERQQLKGLNVLGKVDLSSLQREKKPTPADKKKRQRKPRAEAGASPQGNTTGTQAPGFRVRPGEGQGNRGPHPGHQQQGQGGQGRGPGGGGQNRGPGGQNRGPGGPQQGQHGRGPGGGGFRPGGHTPRFGGGGQSGRGKAAKRQRRDERRERAAAERNVETGNVLDVIEFITVNELANIMDVSAVEVITACMNMGMFVNINQRLDAETIQFVALEFGYEVKFKDAEVDEPSLEEPDKEETTVARAPIVTIMGHVDHGKTSLLDYVRRANVVAGEAGGITQHIGAYEVTLENGRQITFLDTPGHEAFTAMRARGAKVTDIAIIVIAADDTVMPQTREAISHAQAANVPIVFAFNKVDKEGARPDRIREQLAEMNILVEEWGGKFQTQEISAKFGLHVNDLLEKVLFEADLLSLTADPKKRAVGTVVEASLDKGKGIIATILVEKGTLNIGDPILAGANNGRVKAMYNERGQKVKTAGPSTPVQVLGFESAPTAGDRFYVTENEAVARETATRRRQLVREQGIRTKKHLTLDEIARRRALGNFQQLNLIIKGDVDGSVEALADSLQKLSTEEIQVNVVHKGVGQISDSDVNLASASDAIIIGFQVRPSISARRLAEHEQIDIRLYSVIYNAIEEVKAAMEGMLEPTSEEKIVCNVEVREVFRITRVGTVAGCYVLDGKITRNTKVRLVRDGVVMYTGELDSLKRFKEDVREVSAGYECGMSIRNYNDIKVGDIIEGYEEISVARKL